MATVPVKTSIGCMEFGRQCTADQVCCTEHITVNTCVIIYFVLSLKLYCHPVQLVEHSWSAEWEVTGLNPRWNNTQALNPLTPKGDQYVISPYIINTW